VRDVKGTLQNVVQGSVASLVELWGVARKQLTV
jgi:molybdopterin-binding protein